MIGLAPDSHTANIIAKQKSYYHCPKMHFWASQVFSLAFYALSQSPLQRWVGMHLMGSAIIRHTHNLRKKDKVAGSFQNQGVGCCICTKYSTGYWMVDELCWCPHQGVIAVLYPYTAERRDVLGNTSPGGNLESREGCTCQCIPTRGSVRPFSQH